MTAARTVGVRELKARASEVLREVESTGAEFVVTVRGRPVARIEPIGITASVGQVDGMGGTRGRMRDLAPLEWPAFVDLKHVWEAQDLDRG